MTDEDRKGKPWSDGELDAIVTDYFEMLGYDLAGHPYIKSRHSAALMAQIGRSHRSVEFKHQNISAVLLELGLPWIPGYIPKSNYQNAIFDAIDRYLTSRPELLSFAPQLPPSSLIPSHVFVDAPKLSLDIDKIPRRLARLVKKFDAVERDRANRSLGRSGEAFVLEVEHRSLVEAGRADLAHQIRWVSDEDGDGAGYDIFSFDPYGAERLIEVKTTNGGARTPFFLSRNECELASERPQEWLIYRVHMFAKQPQIFTIAPPLEAALHLRPDTWHASF
jgi:hypothetical protein